jgi:4,5-dihydroxyphthalate decarboxylase
MGEDYWPYGVDVNRPTIETLIRYLVRQGLIPSAPSIDDLFPASTRVVSRI